MQPTVVMGQAKIEDFILEEELGRGSYGIVNKVKRRADQKCYVLKRIELGRLKKDEQEAALQEAWLLSRLKHKNVVKYCEAFFHDSETLCIVMVRVCCGCCACCST